jgi:hypothetical protein
VPRVARCGMARAWVGELPIVWTLCEMLVLPPGPAYEHVAEEQGNYPVVALPVMIGTTG